MLAAELHEQEPLRLALLRELNLLDTKAEDRFDAITRYAAQRFQVPIALMSLVDEHRQWLKSSVGLDIKETPRDISFCGHALHQDKIFVVADASQDPRFSDNPVVTGEPHIRFYAGAPLILAEGQPAVGTLCLIDTEPRLLSEDDLSLLSALRTILIQEMLMKTGAELKQPVQN